jgi:hypothetical protein
MVVTFIRLMKVNIIIGHVPKRAKRPHRITTDSDTHSRGERAVLAAVPTKSLGLIRDITCLVIRAIAVATHPRSRCHCQGRRKTQNLSSSSSSSKSNQHKARSQNFIHKHNPPLVPHKQRIK